MSSKKIFTIFLVLIFSLAFAFVEAAVVVYLRHLLGDGSSSFDKLAQALPANKNEVLFLLPGIAFLEPQTALSIIANSQLLNVEMLREAATLMMLSAVAFLAAENFKELLAFFFFAFGIWDIFYYVFLKLIINWPRSFFDLDILFLLPVPWVGPVLVPVVLSLIMVFLSLTYLKYKPKTSST